MLPGPLLNCITQKQIPVLTDIYDVQEECVTFKTTYRAAIIRWH